MNVHDVKNHSINAQKHAVLARFLNQPWKLGKKYDNNFIFTFAVVKVRYGGITAAKIFKHGNYLK